MDDANRVAAEADVELAIAESSLETAAHSLRSAKRMSWLDLSGLLDGFFWQDDKIGAKDTAAYWLGIAQDHLNAAVALIAPGTPPATRAASGDVSGLWDHLDANPFLDVPVLELLADLRAHRRIDEIGGEIEQTAAAVAALRRRCAELK
jgi:hypothetical protein